MSPKFYFSLWMVLGVAAGGFALVGAFTLFTAVVFGFIAFGLTFTGMMCVLPSAVSHPAAPRLEMPSPARVITSASTAPATAQAFTYRSA